MQPLQKSISYNVICKFVNHLLVFIANILITRLLGIQSSGYFFNELYIINFLVFLFSFGFDYSLVYLLAKHTFDINHLCKKLYLLIIVFGLMIVISSKSELLVLQQPFIAVLLFSIGNFTLLIFQSILTAYSKFTIQNTVLLITNSALVIFLLILYYFYDNNNLPNSIISTKVPLALGSVFMLQGLLFLLIVRFGKLEKGDKVLSWGKLLSSGLLMMLSNIIFFVYLRIDNFFVEKYCDATALGNYVQCGKMGQYFLYLPTIVSSTLMPFYVKNNQQLSFKHWKKTILPYAYILLLTALLLVICGSYIFPLLFGKDFNGMYSIMMVLLPGFVGLSFLTLVNTIYFSKGNLKTVIVGDLIGLVLLIVLDFIFVPVYGVYAAAAVSCFCYLVTLLYLFVYLKKQFNTI